MNDYAVSSIYTWVFTDDLWLKFAMVLFNKIDKKEAKLERNAPKEG